MNHRAIGFAATAVVVLGLAATLPGRANDVPKFSASYEVSDVRESADGVSLTFSFVLRPVGAGDATVDSILLADPGTAVPAYATFDGGTLPAGGRLRRSANAVVPESEFERWAASGATLFVITRDGRGDTIRTRVDAWRTGTAA